MSTESRKPGRPVKTDTREPMRKVSFRVDQATWDALRALEEDVGADVRGRTSVLLRKLVLDAFEKRKQSSD